MWPMCNVSCTRIGFVLLVSLAVFLHGCEKPTEATPVTAKDIQPSHEEPPQVSQPDIPVVDLSEFVLVKGGTFTNTKSNYYGKNVTIPDFYIGKYEVTQKQWASVMGSNPSKFKGDNLPVEMVTWYDCVEYCNKRSIKEGLKPHYNIDKNKKDPNNVSEHDDIKWTVTINAGADGYRLPIEAEWEYAAGGGQMSKSYTYSGSNDVNEVGWYWRNSGDKYLTGFWNWPAVESNNNKTKSIGLKKPNELGLYDMSGNVREWCWNWRESNVNEPKGRVWRGGGWMGGSRACVSSFQAGFEASGLGPDQGFRVCRGNLLQSLEKLTALAPITAKDIQPSNEEPSPVRPPAPPAVASSEDGLHVAWRQKTQNGKMAVVIDGQAEPEGYDDIGPIIFSPDSNRVAYPAKRDSKWVMVADGKAGPEYDDISLSGNVFSPDSKRLVYGAMKGNKWFVVVDGKAGPESGHDDISYFIFSPDSKRLVYGARKGDKWFVMLDDKAGPESGHDNVGHFTFSPDSTRLVYAAGNGNRQYMVVDGLAGEVYERVSEPVFSPDGKHLAYLAAIKDAEQDKEQQFVVLDGKEGKKYDNVNRLIFSKDSKHIAYSVMKGPKRIVVVDDKEGPEFEMIPSIDMFTFGPNDSRIAYIVLKDNKGAVVVNQQEGPEYDAIGLHSVVLSPDGESYAYAASKDDKWFVVWNGQEEPEYDIIAMGSPVFSPDGKDLMYAANKDNEWFLVLNGEPIDYDYDDIGDTFLFSPDGRHFVHTSLKYGKWFLVVDDQAGPPYDRVSKPAFKADRIEYLAERDGELLRCRRFLQSDAGKMMTVEEEIGRLPEP